MIKKLKFLQGKDAQIAFTIEADGLQAEFYRFDDGQWHLQDKVHHVCQCKRTEREVEEFTRAVSDRNWETHSALIVIPRDRYWLRFLSLPTSDPFELADAVHMQLETWYGPTLENIAYDFRTLVTSAGDNSQTTILLALANRDDLRELTTIAEGCGATTVQSVTDDEMRLFSLEPADDVREDEFGLVRHRDGLCQLVDGRHELIYSFQLMNDLPFDLLCVLTQMYSTIPTTLRNHAVTWFIDISDDDDQLVDASTLKQDLTTQQIEYTQVAPELPGIPQVLGLHNGKKRQRIDILAPEIRSTLHPRLKIVGTVVSGVALLLLLGFWYCTSTLAGIEDEIQTVKASLAELDQRYVADQEDRLADFEKWLDQELSFFSDFARIASAANAKISYRRLHWQADAYEGKADIELEGVADSNSAVRETTNALSQNSSFRVLPESISPGTTEDRLQFVYELESIVEKREDEE